MDNRFHGLNRPGADASAASYADKLLADYNQRPASLHPEQQPAIMAACSTLDDSVRLAQRVSALVDRLCGAVPVGQATKSVEQGYSSIFDGLRAQAQNASNQINDAFDALNRLDRELP